MYVETTTTMFVLLYIDKGKRASDLFELYRPIYSGAAAVLRIERILTVLCIYTHRWRAMIGFLL